MGLLVSAAAISVLLHRVSVAEIGQRLSRLKVSWLLALVLCKAILLSMKHSRWRQVLLAIGPGPWRGTFRAVSAGYFLNLVLPFKLGEAVRSMILRRHNPGATFGEGLATIGSERLLDAAVLTVLSLTVLPWIEAPGWLREGLLLFVAALGLAVLAAAAAPFLLGWIERLGSSRSRGLGRLVPILRTVTKTVRRGTAVWRDPGRLTRCVGWTLGIWCCDAFILLLATRALQSSVSYPAAIVVTLLYAFGLLIPSGPVQAGTHQALGVLFLTPFGMGEATAVSVSLVLQTANLLVLGLAGAPTLLWELAMRREKGRDESVGVETP